MKQEIKKLVRIGLMIVSVWLIIHYWENAIALFAKIFGAAFPLLLGGMIAYVVNLVMGAYERVLTPKKEKKLWLRLKRPVCMALAFGSVIVGLYLIIGITLPELARCIGLLLEKLPPAIEKAWAFLEDKLNVSETFPELAQKLNSVDVRSIVNEVWGVVSKGVGGAVDIVLTAATSLFSGVVTAFLSLVFSIYLLADKEKLLAQFNRLIAVYMKKEHARKLRYVLKILNGAFHNYIVGQSIEALILGSLCMLGMLILGLPYAPMVGALVGVTALIPVAGAYIGAAFGAFMIFTVAPVKALVFLIYLIILQQLEGNLIFPRVVGSSLGLPGLWVLAAVTVFGGLFGIPGMLIGVPLSATAYALIKENVNQREKEA
ncbi:MAG: AI-2E family transporter [Clostridia bacterium]|nr:AI-2E family transporter [Clostridia bacterium]